MSEMTPDIAAKILKSNLSRKQCENYIEKYDIYTDSNCINIDLYDLETNNLREFLDVFLRVSNDWNVKPSDIELQIEAGSWEYMVTLSSPKNYSLDELREIVNQYATSILEGAAKLEAQKVAQEEQERELYQRLKRKFETKH